MALYNPAVFLGARMRTVTRLLLCLVILSAAARADERILLYRSDITVEPDASLLVKEVIRVRAEHGHIRHGIYRDFPTDYRDRFGNQFSVRFTVDGSRARRPHRGVAHG